MTDFIFRGSQLEVDPEVNELIQIEEERQYKKLILIPSESGAPQTAHRPLCGDVQRSAEGVRPIQCRAPSA